MLWILIFMYFCSFWRLKYTKLTKFTALEIAKTSVFALLNSPKLISHKILKFPHCVIGSLMGNIIFVRGIVVVVSMASITQLVKSSALTRVPSICVDSWQVSIISRYEMVAIWSWGPSVKVENAAAATMRRSTKR